MGAEQSHTLDLKLSLAIIQKGFQKSFKDGLSSVKSEAINFKTALAEWISPEGARFDKVVTYEFRDGDVYWVGDIKPVAYHLEKNTKLLSVQGASGELVSQGKRDEDVWQVVNPMLQRLQPGDAIQYLSQKDPDPSKGVALQQIINDNGVLIHQSHLLPFNDIDQISKFMQFAGEVRQDLSLDEEVSGWIVTGKRIDFDQELPELILESMMPESAVGSWRETIMPVWPRLNEFVTFDAQPVDGAAESRSIGTEDRVASVEPSSFWWQLLAQQADEVIVTPEPVFNTSKPFVLSEKKPLSTEVVEPIEPVVTFQAVKTVPIRAVREIKPNVRQPEKKKEAVAVKKARIEKKREVGQRKEVAEATIYQAKKPEVQQEVKLVTQPKIEAKKAEKRIVVHVTKVIEQAASEPKKVEPEIPWWQINFEGIDANDVPEWQLKQLLWPDFNYLKDLAWLVSIRQFALANTNWYQFEGGLVMVSEETVDLRGSGRLKKAILPMLTEV